MVKKNIEIIPKEYSSLISNIGQLLEEGRKKAFSSVNSIFEVEDENTPNFQLIDDYKTWFENYR